MLFKYMQSRRSLHRTVREANFNCTLPLAQTAQNSNCFTSPNPYNNPARWTVVRKWERLKSTWCASQSAFLFHRGRRQWETLGERESSLMPGSAEHSYHILISCSLRVMCCAGPVACWACRRFVSLPRGLTHGDLLLALQEATLPDFYSRGG